MRRGLGLSRHGLRQDSGTLTGSAGSATGADGRSSLAGNPQPSARACSPRSAAVAHADDAHPGIATVHSVAAGIGHAVIQRRHIQQKRFAGKRRASAPAVPTIRCGAVQGRLNATAWTAHPATPILISGQTGNGWRSWCERSLPETGHRWHGHMAPGRAGGTGKASMGTPSVGRQVKTSQPRQRRTQCDDEWLNRSGNMEDECTCWPGLLQRRANPALPSKTGAFRRCQSHRGMAAVAQNHRSCDKTW